MSVSKQALIQEIEKIAPSELMEEWDNTGIQILANDEQCERALICLDVCEETINEAIEKKCDFIVSHHPMFFNAIKNINCESAAGRYIIKLLSNGISVYASHTSFDTVEGGNNDYLAGLLGLKHIKIPKSEPIMRIGEFPKKTTMKELCELVSLKIMHGQGLTYSGDLDKTINKIGICTGAGASVLQSAAQLGCDVLITGDLKYHDAQNGDALGVNIIDAGHYGTEIFFAQNMAEKLRKAFGEKLKVISSEYQENTLKRFE